MDFLPFSSLLLSVIGASLGILTKSLGDSPSLEVLQELALRIVKKWRPQPGQVVLMLFAALVLIFGAITAWRYWPTIKSNPDQLFYVTWLFITMVAGMFVQVLSSNYRGGRPLFDVSASQLVYPLLFALVVFYPVWAISASAPHNLFSFYAAFLNGFFWETVVANARLPTPTGKEQAAEAG
jgi:hypothetical protein